MDDNAKNPAKVAAGRQGGKARWRGMTPEQRKLASEPARVARVADSYLQQWVDGIIEYSARLTRTQIAALRHVLPADDDEQAEK